MSIKPKDRFLNVNRLRLHYLDWGNVGYQPMLLLHGFMGHAHVWDDFASSLRTHYHVIALDQRGHGESQWSEEEAYSIDDHFLDLAKFIDLLRLKDLIIIGHSMGGRNALFYTACITGNVDRLILVDARPANNSKAAKALKQQLINLPLQTSSLDEVLRTIQTIYPYLSLEICQHIASYGYRQIRHGKFVPKYDARMGLHSDRLGYIAEDLWPFMKNIACPTLIVRGKESPFLSREVARKMCRIIPKAEWREVPKATHLPVQENPNVFKEMILDFLNK